MAQRSLKVLTLLILAAAACGDDAKSSDASLCTPVDDNNPCTTDGCALDQPTHTPLPEGTTCPTGTCSAAGTCVAASSCSDAMMNGTETDVDCGGSCAPTNQCADGKACAAPGDCASGVCTGSVCQAPACGDNVVQGSEACDDGNQVNGDGCDDNCKPSGCGNGVVSVPETCDDANMVNGDGCDNNCTISACGNGIMAGAETCDDGNAAAGDGCDDACLSEPGYSCTGTPSMCVGVCGDGILIGGEVCDDGNMANGDGCSSACALEANCGAGETAVIVTNATATPIPDNSTTGVLSPVSVTTVGAVTKVAVFINSITHTFDGDLELSLVGPALTRALSTGNGNSANDYTSTFLDDGATTPIADGTAPFTGRFKPEQTLSTSGDFAGRNALGMWNLRLEDVASGDTGTLHAWTLLLCVNPTAPYCGDGTTNGVGEQCDDGNSIDTDACDNNCHTNGCGDGNLDPGEQCDDGGIVSGDGCSATCQFEVVCGAGETPVVVTNNTAFPIPDATPAGITSPVTIGLTGAVTKVVVLIGDLTHPFDIDVDMFLIGPTGQQREVSTDQSGANYHSTSFDDGATTAITAGTAPYSGSFRPETTLSSLGGVDFRNTNAAGIWKLKVVDDASADVGTLNSWTLALCVNTTGPYCGDSVKNGTDECDDGNAIDTDACSNLCQIADGCGDGNIDAGEQCDDNNAVSGDGCSATCTADIACAAGEVPVILTDSTSHAIPDSIGGLITTTNVVTSGVVRKVIATVNITYPTNGDLDLFLRTPWGVQRDLSSDQTGANYTSTIFSDAANGVITSGTAPYTGAFRPEQSISDLAGFANQTAAGAWTLQVSKDTVGAAGTLNSWTLAACIDPSVASVCGNGVVEANETCDDRNTTAGDGCSATCGIELTCAVGTATFVRGTGPVFVLDNTPAGVTSTANVSTAGTVRKAIVVLGTITHTWDSDLDISLLSPMGTAIDLSSDNGSSGDDYVSTILDDAAATPVTTSTAPARGSFRPEALLSTLNGEPAAGNWTLKVVDDSTNDVGTLVSWTVGLCIE